MERLRVALKTTSVLIGALTLFAVASLFSTVAVAGEGRIALVIGNGAYRHAPVLSPLKNPTNDARAMSVALKELGFDVVQIEDADQDQLRDAIHDFWVKAQRNRVRVFYYAGHAVSFEHVNYLVPVDADRRWEDDVPRRSYNVDELVDSLGTLNSGVSIVVLDACRGNFFKGRGIPQWARREPPQGTLLALSTASGATASDGGKGQHGLYTKHLLSYMRAKPELLVEQLFKRVGADVAAESRKTQQPWVKSHLEGDFCFKTAAGGKCLFN